MEVVIALSPVDAGIGCWDLYSGAERLRYRSCPSAPHGLNCVGRPFLASSQLRDTSLSSGSILYWSRNKPQVEVKSFPAEPINPFVSNSEGTYLIGGGSSGDIYFWVVRFCSFFLDMSLCCCKIRLLKRWHAHYRAVTCLVLSEDESLLISGAEDGCVRVWSLLMMFDDVGREAAKHFFEHSFSEHTLCVTDVVSGYGGCNAIIVFASKDRTYAVVLDPGEHVFYAGSRDGKISVAALNAESSSNCSYGKHIIVSLSDHSKADTKTRNIVHIFKHPKGPVYNVFIIQQQLFGINRKVVSAQAPLFRRAALSLPPPLNQYLNSSTDNNEPRAVIAPEPSCDEPLDATYHSFHVMKNQIHELQQQGSSAATEMELERLKLDCKRSLEMQGLVEIPLDNNWALEVKKSIKFYRALLVQQNILMDSRRQKMVLTL
ncbi:hypothetical protein NE237_005604 [Protea cynaroides]|uniref:Uncharacterized protein n=1 Tax=Protea cynaroides TaxID=273540 RepID=A0A9Q0GM46_9MAGN|nr:hypothetical protein NE237_005604 [Protea cynaroides]